MSIPDPKYTRRALHPNEGRLHLQFASICGAGDLGDVKSLVESGHGCCCLECLADGLQAAIRSHKVDVTAFSSRPEHHC